MATPQVIPVQVDNVYLQNWRLEALHKDGENARIFYIRRISDNRNHILKVTKSPNGLSSEIDVYNRLANRNGNMANQGKFCNMIQYGTWAGSQYVVLERLGTHVSSPVVAEGQLELFEVIRFAITLLENIMVLHSTGYVHGNITLKNIMLYEKFAYLIDYSKAALHTENDILTGDPLPLIKVYQGKSRGSLMYGSSLVNQKYEPRRSDDIISLVYVLIKMTRGVLPWENICQQQVITEDDINQIIQLKQNINSKELCLELPFEVRNMYLDMCKILPEVEPNYQEHLAALRQAQLRVDVEYSLSSAGQ